MAGVWTLFASILRRDWLRVGLWAVGLVGLQVYAVVAFESIYSSAADLVTYADVVERSPAARAFSGPGYGLDDPNLGAVIANDMLAFLAAGMALMSIFLISRNTRAEEEDGRAELIAAAHVGRHARSIAAYAAVALLNLILGAVFAGFMLANGYELRGSAVLGAATALSGIVFAGLALTAAQVSSHARVATAIAGGALGGAYVVRALGDIGGGGGISWLSPLGWAQAARPFADERVLPLLLLLATAVVLLVVALALERRRDLGGGMIGSRPGPPRGSPYMASAFGFPFRLLRVTIAAWAFGVALLGFVYGTVGTEIEEMIAESPEYADFLAQADGDVIDSYFVTILLVLALVATGFAIQAILRIRTEESAGRAEPLLSTGLSRLRWIGGHTAVTVAGVTAVLTVGGLGLASGFVLVGGEAASFLRLPASALAWVPGVLVVAGLAIFLVGYLPRFALVAWLLLAWFFFVGFFGDALDLPAWLSALSPFEYVPDVPATSLDPAPVLALGVLAVALGALGFHGFRRRDIG